MPQQEYQLHLKGYVGGSDFDRNYVDYVLAQNEDKPVKVLIDSLGGSLATALSIASAFKGHGDVSVHFVGMNASAATVASLGATHITMDSSAMYLVHKCSAEFFEWGDLNADQLAQVVDQCEAAIRDLNKLDNNIASMYSDKCRKPKAELLDLMKAGGWLSAKEALDWGFVDEVTDFNEEKPVLTDALASAMTEAGLPIPNMPTADKEGAFSRFLAALTSWFKSKSEEQAENTEELHINNAKTVIMNQSYALLGKVLEVEDFAVGEGGVTLSTGQMQAIEDALAQRDEHNAELTRQVEALRAVPAEKSQAVVDDNSQHTAGSVFDEFVQTVNNAKALFNLVP